VKFPHPLTPILDGPMTPGVLAVFKHLDGTVDAIRELKSTGHRDFTVYSPLARHELEIALAQPVSPVRAFTLVGGIAGCSIGAWIALYMSYDWPIVVGGKTIGSIPPYVVIMFEMTVLFGALTTLLGVLFNILLSVRQRGRIAWDPRFTNDRFGIFVPASGTQVTRVESLLKECGAEEVRHA
jgi:molybdopterin-containing oxidoreductase family membrane subunit